MATSAEISSFIKLLGKLAVKESNNRIASGKGFVLPSVCIAQSAIETGWGTAGIMVKANAFFGIKAGGSWTGKVYRADTWEVADGAAYNTTANFRAYDSLEESVRDYYDLIGNASRYANGLSFGKNRAAWKTAKECITAIWAGGYATDTLYVEKIMSTINARNLTEYDNLVTGDGTTTLDETLSWTFKKADLQQGSLVITDSGRSIGNDTTVTTALSMPWNKAVTSSSTENLIISQTFALDLYIARLTGDTPAIEGPFKSGDSFSVLANEKFAIMVKTADESELIYDSFTDSYSVTIKTRDLPAGEESYSGGIAFFVKI